MLSDNWVIKNLENAIGTWNEKLAELWQLITQTPESFKDGQIWSVITDINTALVGIGAVFCYGHILSRGIVQGASKAGICSPPFYSILFS